jgi:ArsR family transcriptional regulator
MIVAMNILKSDTEFFEKAINAVADPYRLSIIKEIAKKGAICCSDMVGLTGLSQPTCSHHIKLLAESELLHCRKEGRNNYFTLNKNNFKRLREFFDEFC